MRMDMHTNGSIQQKVWSHTLYCTIYWSGWSKDNARMNISAALPHVIKAKIRNQQRLNTANEGCGKQGEIFPARSHWGFRPEWWKRFDLVVRTNHTCQPQESTVLIKPLHPLKSIPISFEGKKKKKIILICQQLTYLGISSFPSRLY